MCGIFGLVDLERVRQKRPWGNAELGDITDARDAMTHRGPDGQGLWQANGVALAHRRLAILDLTYTGAQPMRGRDGCALTFNGEIYNYLELRKDLVANGAEFRGSSDTEVLLVALQTWGLAQTLLRIRGMYAFAFWDAPNKQLHVARDRVGKKPLYYWQHGERLAFSSTLASLQLWLLAQRIKLDIDPVAVEHFLASGYIEAPRTIFRQVRKLTAGQSMTFDDQGANFSAAAVIPFANPGKPLDGQSLDQLDDLLQKAVERRLRSDVPVATFLSGGLDSALVTAVAARQVAGMTAYTVRTADRNADEFATAEKVAKATGVKHVVLDVSADDLSQLPELVRQYGEPFGDSSALPTYLIAQAAGVHHRVILTGDGGDEVQGGYSGARLFALRQQFRATLGFALPDALAQRLEASKQGGAGDLAFKALRLLGNGAQAIAAQRDQLNRLHDCFKPTLRPILAEQGWQATIAQRFLALPAFNELDRALGLDFSLYLPEDLCVKVDVASMAFAVETRAPLLDSDFTDACWQIDARDRVTTNQSKRIIRQLLARYLPADCILGRKQGFSIPVAQWVNTPALRIQLDADLRLGFAGMPWLDTGALADALTKLDQSKLDQGNLRWRLLWLGQWSRRWNDVTQWSIANQGATGYSAESGYFKAVAGPRG